MAPVSFVRISCCYSTRLDCSMVIDLLSWILLIYPLRRLCGSALTLVGSTAKCRHSCIERAHYLLVAALSVASLGPSGQAIKYRKTSASRALLPLDALLRHNPTVQLAQALQSLRRAHIDTAPTPLSRAGSLPSARCRSSATRLVVHVLVSFSRCLRLLRIHLNFSSA